jgi:hypothetical protein
MRYKNRASTHSPMPCQRLIRDSLSLCGGAEYVRGPPIEATRRARCPILYAHAVLGKPETRNPAPNHCERHVLRKPQTTTANLNPG